LPSRKTAGGVPSAVETDEHLDAARELERLQRAHERIGRSIRGSDALDPAVMLKW